MRQPKLFINTHSEEISPTMRKYYISLTDINSYPYGTHVNYHKINFRNNFIKRVKLAYLVFTGQADAVFEMEK